MVVYAPPGIFAHHTSVSRIAMRWRRETLRMVLYIGIPCVAFTMANLPFASETNIHSVRLSYFQRTGVDAFPKERESIEEARKIQNRFPFFAYRSDE
ncbi:hypothetical protein CRM22_007987 [Opisthorchis felineus]|uniref:Uncharacterized protein n=1 Tax=Opisthorchis felineus TaxID=147828 RepID=A0A4S2LDK8_OPIFE|nr:hypothetical protein CRM22_007987 [Opisthorchis felineus]TGZ61434.1 hypothetical protein CRM22_007987 [Opisthorchis felineus]